MANSSEGIVVEAGPIKHWWDENWDTPAHKAYDEWREMVSAGLVEAGYLVYRPHHAFKGPWDERAQSVNDMALRVADAVINLTPPGVPSLGTDGEVLYAASFGGIIVPAPPTEDYDQGVDDLVSRLSVLNLRRELVEQEPIKDSLDIAASGLAKFTSFLDAHEGSILRLHHFRDDGRIEAIDAHAFAVRVMGETGDKKSIEVDPRKLLKIEVLGRTATGVALV
jgi:hypothetical protein